MKRARRMPRPRRYRYVPIGYYSNRPKLLHSIAIAGLGRLENTRFVVSQLAQTNTA